jgi:hypothetical protein
MTTEYTSFERAAASPMLYQQAVHTINVFCLKHGLRCHNIHVSMLHEYLKVEFDLQFHAAYKRTYDPEAAQKLALLLQQQLVWWLAERNGVRVQSVCRLLLGYAPHEIPIVLHFPPNSSSDQS